MMVGRVLELSVRAGGTFTAEYKARSSPSTTPPSPAAKGALAAPGGPVLLHIGRVAPGPRRRRPGRARRPAAQTGKQSRSRSRTQRLRARRNERLERELAKTRAALEIMGKAHALLELLSESADTETRSKP